MTTDDLIPLLEQAGICQEVWFEHHRSIERFAALVAAAERERVAAWKRARSYATGHGDTIEDLLKELEWQVAEREREACARIADKCIEDSQKVTPESEQEENYMVAMRILSEEFAIAIRARGEI